MRFRRPALPPRRVPARALLAASRRRSLSSRNGESALKRARDRSSIDHARRVDESVYASPHFMDLFVASLPRSRFFTADSVVQAPDPNGADAPHNPPPLCD